MSSMPSGHFSGVVVGYETENGEFHVNPNRADTFLILVKPKSGAICYIGDWSNQLRGLHVDMRIEMDEADVMFVDGRVVYTVDEELRGITVNGVPVEYFLTVGQTLKKQIVP